MHYEITTIGPIHPDYVAGVVLAYMGYASYLSPQRQSAVPALGSRERSTLPPLLRPPSLPYSPFRTGLGGENRPGSVWPGLATSGPLSRVGPQSVGARPVALFNWPANQSAGSRTGPPLNLQIGVPIQLKPTITIQQKSNLGGMSQDVFFWQSQSYPMALKVWAQGAHWSWQRLPRGWDNEELAHAMPADLGNYRPGQVVVADKSVTTMTPAQKLTEAMWRSRSLVGGEVSSVVEQMLSPQAIGYLLAFEAAYTVSLFFGVGELATAIMVIVGVIFVGEEVIEIFDSLHEFVKKATGAKASKDLDEAAKDFAHALTLGVDIVVALLMRRRGRAHGPEQVVRAKSGGGGNKRKTPKYQVEEPKSPEHSSLGRKGQHDRVPPAEDLVKKASKLGKNLEEAREFGTPHGQKVFYHKGKYYSRDADSHNGGVWKVFEKVGGKLKRVGTADENLDIFKK